MKMPWCVRVFWGASISDVRERFVSISAVAASRYSVELLYDAKAGIAEGPFYDQSRNQLLWVDIEGQTINFLDVEKRENRQLKMPDRVGAAIPVKDSECKLVALIGRKICLVDRETGAIDELCDTEKDKPDNRFNDAKCDSTGRLWAGTMEVEKEPTVSSKGQGSLYSYSDGKLTKHLSDIKVSNGIGWSLDNRTMYYIDSVPKKVYSFDFDASEGTLSNQQVFIDYAQDQSLGWPDGLCTDTEGRLWVAGFYGQHVTCWEPTASGGKMVEKIPIPAMRVTSCCFGGPKNNWLFVTTARYRTVERELAAFPHSGGIFLVKGLGAKGFPVHTFCYSQPSKT